jgi:hypothetical protein
LGTPAVVDENDFDVIVERLESAPERRSGVKRDDDD